MYILSTCHIFYWPVWLWYPGFLRCSCQRPLKNICLKLLKKCQTYEGRSIKDHIYSTHDVNSILSILLWYTSLSIFSLWYNHKSRNERQDNTTISLWYWMYRNDNSNKMSTQKIISTFICKPPDATFCFCADSQLCPIKPRKKDSSSKIVTETRLWFYPKVLQMDFEQVLVILISTVCCCNWVYSNVLYDVKLKESNLSILWSM